jgi:hypothetical protein
MLNYMMFQLCFTYIYMNRYGLWCLSPLSTIFKLYTSRRSVLLVEENGVSGENHWPAASHWQTLSHNVVTSTPLHERGSNWRDVLDTILCDLVLWRLTPLSTIFQLYRGGNRRNIRLVKFCALWKQDPSSNWYWKIIMWFILYNIFKNLFVKL